jgi:uncharacterized protein
MNKLTKDSFDFISGLCKKYNVSRLYLCGSALDERFNDKSDIDFIVSFNDIPLEEYASYYFDLKNELEEYFKRSIDLIEEDSLKNPYLIEELQKTRERIYG